MKTDRKNQRVLPQKPLHKALTSKPSKRKVVETGVIEFKSNKAAKSKNLHEIQTSRYVPISGPNCSRKPLEPTS
jgi:hypothetical protein